MGFEQNINTIICGDSLDVMRDWPDGCVDLVFTSPPYNLIREWTGGGPNSGKLFKRHKQRQKEWYNDSMPEDKYATWQVKCIQQMCRISGGSVFYNHKIRYAIKRRGVTYHPYEYIARAGALLWCEITWNRGIPGAGNWPRHTPQDEKIFQLGRPVVWNGYDGGNIWSFPPSKNNGHPCPFPIGLPTKAISACSGPGNLILDPFCGSGTTCVAAKMLGRRYIGIDISEEYCEIARQRLRAVDTGVPVKEQKIGQGALFED